MKVCKVVLLLAVSLQTDNCCGLTIPTVFVGNRGNLEQPQIHGPGQGAVAYNFRIGVTEVTNAQYTEFLNSVDLSGSNLLGLYNSSMSSNANGGIIIDSEAPDGAKYQVKPQRDNFPVVYVSLFDAIRFSNWLHNGQGSGDTETGAYTLGPIGPGGIPINGAISRNADARWWLPSNNEWFKAGYHKNDGPTGNYWDFPTSTNALPYSDQPPGTDSPDPSNTANFEQYNPLHNGYDDGYAVTGSTTFVSPQNYLTEVGAYTWAVSPYGTYDQGGNVFEWNDTLYSDDLFVEYGIRGGSWVTDWTDLRAGLYYSGQPIDEGNEAGFRVATIPEPSSWQLIGLVVAGFVVANYDSRSIFQSRRKQRL